jgi:hypothetical protein
VPSQADTAAFDALKGACPDKAKYPHAARWYRHIESFEAAGKFQLLKHKCSFGTLYSYY